MYIYISSYSTAHVFAFLRIFLSGKTIIVAFKSVSGYVEVDSAMNKNGEKKQ